MNLWINQERVRLVDGDLLGVGGEARVYRWKDFAVKVFHAADLSEAAAYPEPDWVYGLAWAPDGKTFAVGRFDGTGETKTR